MRTVILKTLAYSGGIVGGLMVGFIVIVFLSCLLGRTVTITRPDGVVIFKFRACPELKVTVRPEDCP